MLHSHQALHVELTIQWSKDNVERGRAAGLRPTVREVGFPLLVLLCQHEGFERLLT